jgi:vitamin K-dependent gamma-carboxylase
MSPLRAIRKALTEPADVDIASLVAFRILFGLVMCAAALRTLAMGWVGRFYVVPPFHFTYAHFSFVRPWPGIGMYVHFAVMALAALGIAAGFRYRLCAILYFLTFTYAELIEKAIYLNHYYLVSLLAAWLVVLPAGRAFSVDVLRDPRRRLTVVPAWTLTLLRLQIGVVYVYAGLAKLNRDWLLAAQPLRMWLAARSDLPVLGPVLAAPEIAYLASWTSALFDLSIVWLLRARKTRSLAFAAIVAFHVATGALFPIGLFPFIMIVSATLFFTPDWPRCWVGRSVPGADFPSARWAPPRWVRPLAYMYCLVQLLLPLRQYLEPASVARALPSAWTGRGFNFAWNVMVAEKTGYVRFHARDRESGQQVSIDPGRLLLPFQEHAMAQDPEMVQALAVHAADQLRGQGRDVAVYAEAFASLNGRPAQLMIDPRVDLVRPVPESWILPLE